MEEHIHQSNLIEGFDSQEADDCLMRAWEYLDGLDKLTLGTICKAQKLATLHQTDMRPHWRGYMRHVSDQRVWIAGREGVAPKNVPSYMKVWMASFGKPPYIPKLAHIDFEKIHPFVDGNGRVGRLIMWWQEKRNGEEPTLITYKDRAKYYAWFK